MLNITKPKPDQIDISIAGKIEADEMRAGLDQLLAFTEGMTGGKMLYKIDDFDLLSMGALAVEMRYLPKLFGLLKHIDRVALLSNTEWVKKAARVEGTIFPGLTIETYILHEVSVAQTWLDGGA